MLRDKNIQARLYEVEYVDFELSQDDLKSNLLPDSVIDIDLCNSLSSNTIWSGATVNNLVLDYISLTGLDNFYISDTSVYNSGNINTGYTKTITSATTFTLHPVSGHNTNLIYDITEENENGICSKKLNGGFYQGFYKLHDYPFSLLPSRVRKGWSVNMTIKFPNELSSGITANTLNDIYPENKGFIFYMGTRAENKFRSLTDDEKTNLNNLDIKFTDSVYNTIVDETNSDVIEVYHNNPGHNSTLDETSTSITGDTVKAPIMLSALYTYGDEFITFTDGSDYVGDYHVYNGKIFSGKNQQDKNKVELKIKYPDNEILDNSFGVRINSEGKIGYRVLKSTTYDYCLSGYTSGTTISGGTAYILEEKYSDSKIWTNNDDGWVDISIVFEREIELDDRQMTSCGDFTKNRKGTLKIYVDGVLVLRDKDFYEVIPKSLDTTKELQQGVPFNISIGGGTQGLYESVTFGGIDVNDKNLLLERNFGGTFNGNIKDFKFFIEPIDYPQIIKNFNTKKDIYNLSGNFGGRIVYKPQVT